MVADGRCDCAEAGAVSAVVKDIVSVSVRPASDGGQLPGNVWPGCDGGWSCRLRLVNCWSRAVNFIAGGICFVIARS